MAEPVMLRCTLCDPEYSQNQTFGSQKDLDDHIALHSLVTSGKLMKPAYNFFCRECYDLYTHAEMTSYASALVHLKIHEQMKRSLKDLAVQRSVFAIQGSKVCCTGCSILNKEIDRTTIGYRQGTKKDLFDSASEFVQHFISVHMKTAPKVVNHAWTNNDGVRFRAKQCSFCGAFTLVYSDWFVNTKSWWESHIHDSECDCVASHKRIQQGLANKIVDMKAITSLLLCHKQARSDDSPESLLSTVDNLVIKKIVKRML